MPGLLLNSGGLDSALLAAAFPGQHSLHIDFSTLKRRESSLKAAAETAKKYCLSHTIIEFALPSPEDNVGLKVMNMDTIVLPIGQAFARIMGYDSVMAGLKGHFDQSFENQWNYIMSLNKRAEGIPQIKLPLIPLSVHYDDIANNFNLNLLEFKFTHSCRQKEPCGECWKCKERKRLNIF